MSQRGPSGSTAPSALRSAKQGEGDMAKGLKKTCGMLETKLTTSKTTSDLYAQVEGLEEQLESVSELENTVSKLLADVATL